MAHTGRHKLWLLLPAALGVAACPAPGPSSTGSGADVTGEFCDTDPQITAGGDHGAPWVPGDGGADETGDEPSLDVGVLPAEQDPTAWQSATQGGATVKYRSPTANEMSQYGWTSEHPLVVLPTTLFTTKVTGAQSTATAYLPRHDVSQSRPQLGLDIEVVALTRQWSTTAMPYYERTYPASGGATTRVLHPRLAFYLPTGASTSNPPNYLVSLVASSRGGIELLAGDEWERVSLRGPFKTTNGPFALDLPPPSGGTTFYVQETEHDDWLFAMSGSGLGGGGPGGPGVSLVEVDPSLDLTIPGRVAELTAGKCADNFDNDPDGFADDCDYNCVAHNDFGGAIRAHTATWEYSKDYALIGDLEFCSCVAPGMAEATLTMFALDASKILNNVQPPAAEFPMDVRSPPFRVLVEGCLYRPPGEAPEVSCEQARDCHSNNTCPGSLAGYPLAGYDNDYSSMRATVWDVFDGLVAGKPAADVHPVHLAGIITTEDGAVGNTVIKGLADYQIDQPHLNGAFVASALPDGINVGAVGANIAHEIGHTLGLGHEDGDAGNGSDDPVLWPGTSMVGFMNSGNGQAPLLNWTALSLVGGLTHGEVWQLLVPSKFWPRSSGFEFTGCDDPTDCQTGHPGLTCGPTGQCQQQ